MDCPFCTTELIDAYHDNLWKDGGVDVDDYYYCVTCELTFDRDNLELQQIEDQNKIRIPTANHRQTQRLC